MHMQAPDVLKRRSLALPDLLSVTLHTVGTHHLIRSGPRLTPTRGDAPTHVGREGKHGVHGAGPGSMCRARSHVWARFHVRSRSQPWDDDAIVDVVWFRRIPFRITVSVVPPPSGEIRFAPGQLRARSPAGGHGDNMRVHT